MSSTQPASGSDFSIGSAKPASGQFNPPYVLGLIKEKREAIKDKIAYLESQIQNMRNSTQANENEQNKSENNSLSTKESMLAILEFERMKDENLRLIENGILGHEQNDALS